MARLARDRPDERALTAARGERPAGAPQARSAFRRTATAPLVVLGAAVVLGALFPGVRSSPDPEAEAPEVRDPGTLVRVTDGGVVLVWDKEHGWLAGKTAELFPSVARRILPCDYVEDAGRLVRARHDRSVPWWRGADR